jgi:hypothetical protein
VAELVTMHDVNDWVKTWLGGIIERRNSNTKRWCPRWFEHPEAVARIWQMYMGYRQVKDSGNALDFSNWMLDHLDRHIDRLMAADGPFSGCSPTRHTSPRQLEMAEPEPGLWGPRVDVPAFDDHPTKTARPDIVKHTAAPAAAPKHAHRPRH